MDTRKQTSTIKQRKNIMRLIPYRSRNVPVLHSTDGWIDRLFSEFWGDSPLGTLSDEGRFNFGPFTGYHEDGENVYVEVELPGVKKKEVNLTLEGNRLTVSGERKESSDKASRSFTFRRHVSLPETIAGDKAKADLTDGVLKITFPKKEEQKGRVIEID